MKIGSHPTQWGMDYGEYNMGGREEQDFMCIFSCEEKQITGDKLALVNTKPEYVYW